MRKIFEVLLEGGGVLREGARVVYERMLLIKSQTWYKLMLLTGVLALSTFAYSFVLVPVWTYAIVPAWSWIKTPRQTQTPTPTVNMVNARMPSAPQTAQTKKEAQPVYRENPATPKPVNCDTVVRKIRAGKYVELPEECRSVYEISRQQDAEREASRQAQQQEEYDRQQQAQYQQQQLEAQRQQEAAQRREEQRRQMEYNAEIARQKAEQERRDREEQEQREERRREQARQDALERQRRQEELQRQKNEAIIKLGQDLKKIFKKNN